MAAGSEGHQDRLDSQGNERGQGRGGSHRGGGKQPRTEAGQHGVVVPGDVLVVFLGMASVVVSVLVILLNEQGSDVLDVVGELADAEQGPVDGGMLGPTRVVLLVKLL